MMLYVRAGGNKGFGMLTIVVAVIITLAVLGIGGLGHLGVQFAARMGFNTVAIARGKDKEAFAKKLGAHQYNLDMAATLQTALVPLVIYFASGKWFVRGITAGAVKG